MTTGIDQAIKEDPTNHGKHNRCRYGYAAPPGTGPDGQTCGTCLHMKLKPCKIGTVIKCGIIPRRHATGSNTDIDKRTPACVMWGERAQ